MTTQIKTSYTQTRKEYNRSNHSNYLPDERTPFIEEGKEEASSWAEHDEIILRQELNSAMEAYTQAEHALSLVPWHEDKQNLVELGRRFVSLSQEEVKKYDELYDNADLDRLNRALDVIGDREKHEALFYKAKLREYEVEFAKEKYDLRNTGVIDEYYSDDDVLVTDVFVKEAPNKEEGLTRPNLEPELEREALNALLNRAKIVNPFAEDQVIYPLKYYTSANINPKGSQSIRWTGLIAGVLVSCLIVGCIGSEVAKTGIGVILLILGIAIAGVGFYGFFGYKNLGGTTVLTGIDGSKKEIYLTSHTTESVQKVADAINAALEVRKSHQVA